MNESLKRLVVTGLSTYVVFKVGQLTGVCKTLEAFMDRTDEDKLNDSITVGNKFKFTITKKIDKNK